MALSENERSVMQNTGSDEEIEAILGWFKGDTPPKELGVVDPLRPQVFVLGEKQEARTPSLTKVPRVKNINEYASRMVEAEIAAQSPIPTVRRPLSVKRFVSLIPTILG